MTRATITLALANFARATITIARRYYDTGYCYSRTGYYDPYSTITLTLLVSNLNLANLNLPGEK